MADKKTLRNVLLGIVIVLVCFVAGTITGCVARGGESATERARAERYLADYKRVEARVGELEGAIADAQKHGRESDAIIADLRGAAIELAKIKRELTIGIDDGLRILDRVDDGIGKLEKGFQRLSADGGTQ